MIPSTPIAISAFHSSGVFAVQGMTRIFAACIVATASFVTQSLSGEMIVAPRLLASAT
jgi:hypothetical protein